MPFEELRRVGWVKLPLPDAPFADGGFPTPGGRAQCAPAGIGLPDYVPPYESVRSAPELARRFPLAMISPPARNFLNSTFVNVKSLRAIEQEPVLEIEAADAAARGIADGDEVRVFNDRGEYRCVARVSERARAGVVHGLGVWWRKYGRRRHQRQRADPPAPDRHGPRAVVLRLPGRGRAGGDRVSGARPPEAARNVVQSTEIP